MREAELAMILGMEMMLRRHGRAGSSVGIPGLLIYGWGIGVRE